MDTDTHLPFIRVHLRLKMLPGVRRNPTCDALQGASKNRSERAERKADGAQKASHIFG
jgi:hypothetical protein